MKIKLVELLLSCCLMLTACTASGHSERLNSFTGTWMKQTGVFGKASEMYLVRVNVGTRVVTPLYSDTVGHTLEGAVSPDGDFLVVNGWDREQDSNNLYLVSLRTGEKQRLSSALGEEDDMVWLDNTHFVYRYVSHENGQAGLVLYVMDVSTGDTTQLLPTSDQPYYFGDVALSPSRRYLAYTKGLLENFLRPSQPFHNSLVAYDLKEKKEVQLYRHATKTIGAFAFSPTGRQIALVLWEKGPAGVDHKSDLVILDTATKEERTVIHDSTQHYEISALLFLAEDQLLFSSAPQDAAADSGVGEKQRAMYSISLANARIRPFSLVGPNREPVQSLDFIKPNWR